MLYIIFILLIVLALLCVYLRNTILKVAAHQPESEKIKPPYAVISVKNGEDCIEGVIRSMAWQLQTQAADFKNCINELIVVDLGSTDETSYIVKKLSQEYPFVHYMNKTQYLETISSL